MKWLNLKKGELEEILMTGAVVLCFVLVIAMIIRFLFTVFIPLLLILTGIFIIGYIAKRTGLIEKIEKRLF
jgi:hypothetical protein